ncbi:hypothetical protein D7I65_24300 [Escherichia albertii]|nr:hypothetical protein [Escherichia albertii]
MERIIYELTKQVEDLRRENLKTKTAANFLLYSIVEVLDQQNDDEKFSEALRARLNSELSKISMGGTSVPKHAINELMHPPVRAVFGNDKPEPFLK